MIIRKAIAAGRFYPGVPELLRSEIGRMIMNDIPNEKVSGLVSPHAGYMYSGSVAGATLSLIEFPDTFVIIGPNHTGRGARFSIMTEGTWETPLGAVEIDAELAGKILGNSELLIDDEFAHAYEHSIEVQLPFLQYFKNDVKIVPIVIAHSSGDDYKKIGKSIAKAVKASGQDVVVMASSDMTHYESQDSARKKDMMAIEAVLDLDEDRLLRLIKEFNITMCGYGPTVSLIVSTKDLGAKGAELVQYQTSGDVTGDYSSVVGYAGVIIR